MDFLFKHISKITERISDSLVLFVIVITGGAILLANVTAAGIPVVSNLGPITFVDGSTTDNPTPKLTFDVAYPGGHGQVRYEIQIIDITNHNNIVTDYVSDALSVGSLSYTVGQSGGSYISGSEAMTLSDSNYNWKVKALDASSALLTSGYSQASVGTAFVVSVPAPALEISHVRNSDPAGGQPIAITWTTNVGSSSLVEYGLDDSYGQATDETDLPKHGVGGVTEHYVELPELETGTTYHYRVSSTDGDGNTVSSDDASFNLPVANNNPESPKDLGPADLISGWTIADPSDFPFEFKISDPDNDNVQYRLLIDNDSDFSSPSVDYMSALDVSGTMNFTLGQSAGSGTYSIGEENQTLANGSYYWAVRVFDENGGDSGSYISATVDSPAFVVDSSYVNVNPTVTFRDVNVDGSKIRDSAPVLSMTLADGNTDDLVSYRILIDNNSDFSSPTVDYTAPADTTSTLAQGRYDFTVGQAVGDGVYSVGSEGQTLSDGTYYVEAQVSDNRAGRSSLTAANGGASAFTVDTVAPEISSIGTNTVTGSAVTITWTTTEASSTEIEYGTTDSYGDSAVDGTLTTNHSVTLTGLSEATLYHYRVTSTDEAGNVSSSDDHDVTTLDVTAPTISSVNAGTLTGTGATITWTTNEASDSQVEYGTTTSYGASTTLDATIVTSHSVELTSLIENRIYHYRVKSRDASGNLRTGTDHTFMTLDQTGPEISNIVATPSGDSVTVTWDTDEASSSRIEYGTTTSYGFLTSQIDTSPRVTSHAVTVSGFGTSGERHFRVLSTDDSSNTTTSDDGTFIIDLNHAPDLPTSLGGDDVTGGGNMSDTTPSFTFTLNDDDFTDEVQYQIQIDDTVDFSSPVVDYTSALGAQMSKTFIVGQAAGSGTYAVGEEGQTLSDGTYYWHVRAIDEHTVQSEYVAANSGDVAFILSTTPTEGPVISNVSVEATNTSATFTWTTDRNAFPKVEYGITSSYELSVDLLSLLRSGVTSHEVTLTDLIACTKYHFRPVVTDEYNNVTNGDDGTFATTGCPGDSTISVEQSRQITALHGGRVTLADDGKQVDLDVPVSFTNSTNAVFQVKKLSRTEVLSFVRLPEGYQAIGDHTYDFKSFEDPQNLISNFDSPITITMQYTDGDIVGIDESSLKIYRFDGADGTELPDCLVDVGAKIVTCSTSGFSTFVLSGQSSGGGTTTGSTTSSDTTTTGSTGTTTSSDTSGATTGTTGGDTTSGTSTSGTSGTTGTTTTTGSGSGGASYGATIIFPQSITKSVKNPVGGVIAGKPSRIIFSRNLKLNDSGVDVKALQMYLNQHGYIITKTGVGSPGNETTTFGSKTKAALIKFQKDMQKSKTKKLKLVEKLGDFGTATKNYINGK